MRLWFHVPFSRDMSQVSDVEQCPESAFMPSMGLQWAETGSGLGYLIGPSGESRKSSKDHLIG